MNYQYDAKIRGSKREVGTKKKSGFATLCSALQAN
nr:MAG TPA: hypothetical protein [Caudoviricetes sp.]